MVSMGLEDPNQVPPVEEGDTEVSVGLNNPTSATPAEVEVACSVENCGFVTTSKVPINGELEYEMQLVQLQMEELHQHHIGVHGVEVDGLDWVNKGVVVNDEVVHADSDAPTMTKQEDQLHEGFVGENADITAATFAELEDATDKTAPKGWIKFSSRSKKSKHRKKSKRF